MFYILILFILIGIVSVATVYVVDEPGYVMLQWGLWQVELSLVLGVLLVVLAALFIFVAIEVLSGIVRIPGRLGRSYREYREQKKYAASIRGLRQLLLGNWAKAEQLLDGSARYLSQPVIVYLAAAYAAQQQKNLTRRDRYLNKARALGAQNQELVSIIACRLQMDSGEILAAIDELKKLCAKMPKNAQAFGMLADAYEVNGDWAALEQLLPHLQKSQARATSELKELAEKIVRHRLQGAQQSVELQSIWRKATGSAQKNPELLAVFVRKLLEFDCHLEAEKITRSALDRHWNSELVYFYGLIDGHVKDRRLYDTAAKWLDLHSDDPNLLLTVGRLARRVELPEIARKRLLRAIDLGGKRDAYEELGNLLEEQNEHDLALAVYRAGIEERPVLLNDESTHPSEADGYSVSDENSKES